jgi:hypothetical protein
MTKNRFELAPKATKAEKATQGKTGFVPVATRWGKRTVKCLDGTLSRVWSKTNKRTLSHATAKRVQLRGFEADSGKQRNPINPGEALILSPPT